MAIQLLKTKLSSLVLGLLLATSANANLIQNGGFEDNKVAPGGWSYYSAASVNGWEGSNIEIWNHFGGVSAPEGQQIAELNAHPYTGNLFSIYQTFSTVIGQSYDVSFFYSARASIQESFTFKVAGLSQLIDDHVVGVWNQYHNTFVASSLLTTLSFTSGDSSTVGNLLDGVVVDARATVPEPGSLALLALGLLALSVVRSRIRS